MPKDPSDAGAVWLAESARGTSSWAVWTEWSRRTYAVLPTGVSWDVIAVPRARFIAAARRRPELLTDVPVLEDLATGFAYVWVPPGTHTDWDLPGTTALGHPWFVAVPRPGGPQVPERRWAQPPGLFPRLMDPADLRTALDTTSTPRDGREDHR
ncbi:hypothetical protein ACF1BN_22040 [Streptomyces sp. NPDC014861]|uniref:hypothetical protein n=1 Tax=Streptomyces sp. NPDC014861 TaxID=3364923 RepID=UPI0037002759